MKERKGELFLGKASEKASKKASFTIKKTLKGKRQLTRCLHVRIQVCRVRCACASYTSPVNAAVISLEVTDVAPGTKSGMLTFAGFAVESAAPHCTTPLP